MAHFGQTDLHTQVCRQVVTQADRHIHTQASRQIDAQAGIQIHRQIGTHAQGRQRNRPVATGTERKMVSLIVQRYVTDGREGGIFKRARSKPALLQQGRKSFIFCFFCSPSKEQPASTLCLISRSFLPPSWSPVCGTCLFSETQTVLNTLWLGRRQETGNIQAAFYCRQAAGYTNIATMKNWPMMIQPTMRRFAFYGLTKLVLPYNKPCV